MFIARASFSGSAANFYFRLPGLPPNASQSIKIYILHIYHSSPTELSGQTDHYENVFSGAISDASFLANKGDKRPQGSKLAKHILVPARA